MLFFKELKSVVSKEEEKLFGTAKKRCQNSEEKM